MFNIIDKLRNDLQSSLSLSNRKDKNWIYQLLNAVNEMKQKLKSYYIAATEYIFLKAYLLDPTTKISLFEFRSFIEDLVN